MKRTHFAKEMWSQWADYSPNLCKYKIMTYSWIALKSCICIFPSRVTLQENRNDQNRTFLIPNLHFQFICISFSIPEVRMGKLFFHLPKMHHSTYHGIVSLSPFSFLRCSMKKFLPWLYLQPLFLNWPLPISISISSSPPHIWLNNYTFVKFHLLSAALSMSFFHC